MKALLTATIFHLNGFSNENSENSKSPGVQNQCHSSENSFQFYINKRNSNEIFFRFYNFQKNSRIFQTRF